MHFLRINIVYLLTRLKQYTKRLRLRDVRGVPLLVILIFKLLKEIEAAKLKLSRGVSKEINMGRLTSLKNNILLLIVSRLSQIYKSLYNLVLNRLGLYLFTKAFS